jgi:SET domain-containing protein
MELRESPEAGRSWFAKASISRGTRILTEDALLVLEEVDVPESVVFAFEKLSQIDQAKYLNLSSRHDNEHLGQYSFYETNGQQTLSDLHCRIDDIFHISAYGDIVCYFRSFFNHSCMPNVGFCYNSAIKKADIPCDTRHWAG